MYVDVEGEKKVVKMVVMDGIVMGPTCCVFDGCEGALVNARAQGDSFCIVHKTEFQDRCHVRDCQNTRDGDTQACHQHHNDWYRYTQSRTTSSLAGVCRMFNHPNEHLE
jgi:hypothetical protein